MNPVWILLLATFASADYNGIFDQCNTQFDVKSASHSYGSLNGFYDIAKGISDGLQKKLPDQAIQQIYDFITGSGSISTGTVINDVVKSQAGAIAFFCVGLLVILISLILGFVTCCCRCYCSGCGASKEQDADTSKVPLLLIFVLMLACFSFIITGIIIYNQSTTNMFDVVNVSNKLIEGVILDLNSTLLIGTAQITCAINNSMDATFSQTEANMQAYPVNIFNQFYNLTGVTAFQQANTDSISGELVQAADLSQSALNSLNGIQGCDLTVLRNQLQQTNQKMQAASLLWKNAGPILVAFNQVITEANDQEANMNTTILQVITAMNDAEAQVNTISTQVNNALTTSMEMIYNIQNALDTAHNDIVTWSGYNAVQGGVRAVMTVPNAIALFFISVITLAILYRIIVRNDPQNRSFPSRALGCFAVVGFYVLIFLTWLAMGIASATFVGGWAISGVCVPMFQDNTFAAYGVLNQLSVNISGLDGTSTSVTTQSLLLSCSRDETIFNALNGDTLINPTMIWNMINISQYETEIENIINELNNNVPTPQINNTEATGVNQLQSNMLAEANIYNTYNGVYMSPTCGPADKVKKTTQLLNQLTELLNTLSAQTTSFQLATNTSIAATNNPSSVTDALVNQTNTAITETNTLINGSLYQLMDQLNTNTFHCGSLYTVFENAGSIMCDQFGRPVHGLWASAGLAALFFIPAAFGLLYASVWLLNMKYGRRRSQLNTGDRQPKTSKKDKNASAPWEDDDVFMKPSIYDNSARTNQIAPMMMAAPAARSDIYLERPNTERQTSYGLPRATESWGVDDEVSIAGSGLRRLGQPQMSYDSSRPSGGLTRTNDSFEAPTTGGWSSSSQLRRM